MISRLRFATFAFFTMAGVAIAVSTCLPTQHLTHERRVFHETPPSTPEAPVADRATRSEVETRETTKPVTQVNPHVASENELESDVFRKYGGATLAELNERSAAISTEIESRGLIAKLNSGTASAEERAYVQRALAEKTALLKLKAPLIIAGLTGS